MIREFSIELTKEDAATISAALARPDAATRAMFPEPTPGRKTFAFERDAVIVLADGDFERFLWTAFDRIEERDGNITLARGTDLVFYLPVAKLQDPEIRNAIRDFVTARVGLHS